MSQKISWFIESEGKLQRVEEDLVAISDKELSFSRKNEKFLLQSDVSIAPFVYGDVVFMTQQASNLIPIRLPVVGEEALLTQEEIDEIVNSQVKDLAMKVEECRNVISRLLNDKSDVMNLQSRIFEKFAEFRQYLQEKAGEAIVEKVDQQKALIEAKKTEIPLPPVNLPPAVPPQPEALSVPPKAVPPPPPPTPPTSSTVTEEKSSYRMFFNSGGKKRWT